MAGSRTYARGFRVVPSTTEKCYFVRLFRSQLPDRYRRFPTIPDRSVRFCVRCQELSVGEMAAWDVRDVAHTRCSGSNGRSDLRTP